MNTSERPGTVAFMLEDLSVHPATGRISGPHGEVSLEPRVMAVLDALARSPGELVTRSELLSTIWPGGDVYDEALTQCVYQLRQQLFSAGGTEAHRKLITTYPKRGFVLEAKVSPIEEKALPPGSRSESSNRWWSAYLVIVLGTAIALLLGTLWLLQSRQEGPETHSAVGDTHTLAVLPFLPLAEAERQPVLELGMADTLIARLGGIRKLVVRPMSSVRGYVALERDALAAGRDLGVEAVLDGSIQRSGDTLRVTARLLRVADGAALWAGTFSEPFSNVFSVQDDLCARIVSVLSLELRPELQAVQVLGGTNNIEAYEQYLQGRYRLSRLTPHDMRASIENFRRAVALDPNYAQAWLGLANVQFRIPIAGEAQPREFYPKARRAALKALEIDPGLAEGHAMLGWIAHWFEWDWAASEEHFKRAIAINSNETESHLGYAHLLQDIGRHKQALEEVQRARELSPAYPVAVALEGGFLLRAGRSEEALRRMLGARNVGENFWLFHVTLAGAYFTQGQFEEALGESAKAREVSGGSTWAMAVEVGLLAALDRRDEAVAMLEQMEQKARQRYVPPYDLAVAYRSLDNQDAAMSMLAKGFEVRDPKMVFLAVGGWDQYWHLPEFQRLLKRMNLQVQM